MIIKCKVSNVSQAVTKINKARATHNVFVIQFKNRTKIYFGIVIN